AELLQPFLPAGRAELHLLPAADAAAAGPDRRPDAGRLPVPGEAAEDGQPRGEPARPAPVQERGRGAAAPRQAGRPALPAATGPPQRAPAAPVAANARPGACGVESGGGVPPPLVGAAGRAGVAGRARGGPGVGGRAGPAGAVPARPGLVGAAPLRPAALAQRRR